MTKCITTKSFTDLVSFQLFSKCLNLRFSQDSLQIYLYSQHKIYNFNRKIQFYTQIFDQKKKMLHSNLNTVKVMCVCVCANHHKSKVWSNQQPCRNTGYWQKIPEQEKVWGRGGNCNIINKLIRVGYLLQNRIYLQFWTSFILNIAIIS